MNDEVTIILVSHKSKNLVLNFIKNFYTKYKILIIDNSKDIDLKNILEKKYPEITIRIIENNGYASAINYGSKLVKTNYFLISNPDIEGLTPININKFLDVAKNLNDNFSLLGPRYIGADKKSHIQSNPKIEIAEMKFISGACMFFKKEIFDKLGGFDENFFLYFEESDFCLRAHKINKNYQINTIEVKHNVGSSVKVENADEKNNLIELYNWHFIWSKFYYYKKNYGYIFSLFYFFPIIIRIIFKINLNMILKNSFKEKKYKIRLDGLISSIRGKKSYKRID
jgi:N-acetylglucosaminyl-diphospho-decaprenol L-rhamnosyltransferase